MTKVLWAAIRLSTAIAGSALLLTSNARAAQESAEPTSDPFNSASEAFRTNTQQTATPNPTPLPQKFSNYNYPVVAAASAIAPKKTTFAASNYPMSAQLRSRESQLSESSAIDTAPTITAENLSPPHSPRQFPSQNAACTSESGLLDFDSSSLSTDEPSPCLEQVNSVSQLSDVQPTDWAFGALQSLVERYGVIAGYPDGTYRGNRSMTRYEFAAGLNAALEKISQLIATDPTNFVLKEDLAKLDRLSAEFAAELSTLRGRADSLEVRTENLEVNQFSTTTKLNATISFNMAAANAGGDVKVERIDPGDSLSAAERGADGKPIVTTVKDSPSVTFSQIAGLFLTTSFTGNDLLVTTLAAGNGNSPANYYASAGWFNTFGVSGLDITPTVTANDLGLIEAFYVLPLNPSLQIAVGPRMLWGRYFDTNAFTSSFGRGASSFNTYASTLLNDVGRGGGVVVLWRWSEKWDFRVGYVAVPDGSNPTTGFFNGNRAFTTELTYSPSRNVNIRLIYDRAELIPINGQISSRPLVGVADDGLGGDLEDATANSFGINFDWLVSPRFGVFGRYTYANTHLNPATNGVSDGHVKAQALQLGVAFPDLGKKGAMATLSYVIPFSVLDGRRFLVAGGGDGGIEYDIEATYYFPLTDNIAIIPTFNLIGNPNNFSDNPNIYTGTVRTQFNF